MISIFSNEVANVSSVVVEDLVKEVKGGLQGRLEGNGCHHLKEEQKLGGGAHQGQSDWSKTTGAMDL
ncbi:hypothetical protein PPACK8108_LOCUS37 [Phakopsora pachyrhizi]|uniref:Uncharacterized protein n=1 Tax=Phakopsora pachyrhizi TaxID=170000 RepID=A0AAV0AEF8_PHAPC|nr:hypothetical protein PPACK8108_LOCUS37 [Phakopsora pachyrhizi]